MTTAKEKKTFHKIKRELSACFRACYFRHMLGETELQLTVYVDILCAGRGLDSLLHRQTVHCACFAQDKGASPIEAHDVFMDWLTNQFERLND